ncbi:MAG TPA: transglutaminase-like domain-containing protein, partial [Herpetosiphonaceae bacterium]
MLMDVGAIQAQTQHQPATLESPFSLSRTQVVTHSAQTNSDTVVLTFSVTNNQSPSIAPPLPASDSITDTIAAAAGFDFSNDPNTIHDVMIADTLTTHATFVTSEPHADVSDSHYIWNLGDIPPLTTITATLTLQAALPSSGTIDLDSGAAAWGSLKGRAIMAQARPVSLGPVTIDGAPASTWLQRTIDADTTDPYMLVKAAELGQDPGRIFEYVRGLGYEAYSGSLRGTRGTLWSEAGNALDQSSLLIAMLRASGIPARYRHGTLAKAEAQTLIRSMFSPTTQLLGHIPAGTEVSDPANDAKLLAEAQDHWWVEAYLPGSGW